MSAFFHIVPEWIELLSLAFCIGALVCRLWVFAPSPLTAAHLREELLAGMWRIFGIGIAAMIVSSSANLLMRATEISGKSFSDMFPLLPKVVFQTHIGRVWLVRITALVLLCLTLKMGGRRRDSRGFLLFMFLLTLISSMTESAWGHASDSGDFSLPEITDWLHLLAASVWGGGLFVLSFILPELVRPGERAAPLIAGVAARFSRIAGMAVGLIAITALYNAWFYAGSVEAVLKTPYGQTMIAKIVLFLILINLGAFNRYISVPRLQEWAFPNDRKGLMVRLAEQTIGRLLPNRDGRTTSLRFGRSVRIEAVLMAAVLLCVAILRHEIPARHLSHIEHMRAQRAAQGPEPGVSIETTPANISAGTPVAMTVRIKTPDGRPFGGLELSHERMLHAIIIGKDLDVFAHIHPEDLGHITDELVKKATFPLRFTFPRAGEYLVGIDFSAGGAFHSKTLHLTVSGRPSMEAPAIDLSTQKDFGGYRVTLSTSPETIKAGEETTLKYMIEKDGRAVTDLEPYLGASMHLAVVSEDLGEFIHVHGFTPGESHEGHDHMHAAPPKKFGPEIDAEITFPAGGVYKVFGQVKHGEKVLLFDFMVRVR